MESGDTVYRQDALDALRTVFDTESIEMTNGGWYIDYDGAVGAIEELPSAQPGWIPWDSGSFPEESGTYTVTAYDGATKRVTYAKYQKRLKRWELTGARAYWRVLAWMEKPKPWEGGQDG